MRNTSTTIINYRSYGVFLLQTESDIHVYEFPLTSYYIKILCQEKVNMIFQTHMEVTFHHL